MLAILALGLQFDHRLKSVGALASLAMALACGGSEEATKPRPGPAPSADVERPEPSPTPVTTPTPEPTPTPTPPTSEAPPPAWSALPEAAPPKTPDGIPILTVDTEGAQWDITPAWNTLIYGQRQASDGWSTFAAVRQDEGTFTDVVIRGGEVRTNVLRRLLDIDQDHPGGCAASADGTLLLSAPVPGEPAGDSPDPASMTQVVWIIGPDGAIARHRLPADAGGSTECHAVVDRAKRFSLFAHRLAEYDGEAFELDEHWRADRTLLTTPLGPRYCFNACNEQETAGTSATIVSAIDKALGDCYPRYAVTGDFVAARCHRSQTVVRIHVPSMKVETLPGLPSTNLGDDRLVLTLDGHVVIQLGVLMQRYMVWSHDTGELSPARSLEQGEILAQTSPTVLVRGLPEPLPRATVSAVAMGQPLSFNPRDIDRANHAIDRGPGAHHARSERAAAVLPKGDFVIAHEAAVQLACGAYVRAPIGYEGEPFAHDFDPPVMPPLSPKAVHQPEPCLPLAEVHAVPGAPDLLLAKTADGQLATAWLPPPLPVTAHTDRRRPMPEPPAGPPPEPRPGPGWVVLGPIDSIAGIPGSPSPGTNPPAMSGWQRGGGAVLTVDGSTIVLTPGGVWTVPDGTKGMAVQLSPEAKLYGALGAALVVCDNTCRTLTPSDGREILSVVPRTQGEVIIGYGEGEEDATVVRLPARGGTETAAHALQESLRAQLRARPVP